MCRTYYINSTLRLNIVNINQLTGQLYSCDVFEDYILYRYFWVIS